jgi:hypothetical protein
MRPREEDDDDDGPRGAMALDLQERTRITNLCWNFKNLDAIGQASSHHQNFGSPHDKWA